VLACALRSLGCDLAQILFILVRHIMVCHSF
jgi:hypothetical protein